MRLCERLIGWYPEDVRFAYGTVMLADLHQQHSDNSQQGLACLTGSVWNVVFTLMDVAAERVNALYSHRSFHGRGMPNPGVVRPPNMGKEEWFGVGNRTTRE